MTAGVLRLERDDAVAVMTLARPDAMKDAVRVGLVSAGSEAAEAFRQKRAGGFVGR